MSDIGRSQFQTSLLVLGLAYKGDNAMSLGLILVIGLVIFLLGGFSDRFRGYGYGFGDGSNKCATETELVGWACRIRTGKCDFEGRLLQSCCAQGLRALRSWTSATKSFGSVMIIVQDLASRLVFPLIT
jgi:hypothetical protein